MNIKLIIFLIDIVKTVFYY